MSDSQPQQVIIKSNSPDAAAGGTYGLGLIGALVYYIQEADSLWTGFLGVLKALFWPAFLVYDALKALGS